MGLTNTNFRKRMPLKSQMDLTFPISERVKIKFFDILITLYNFKNKNALKVTKYSIKKF